MERAENTPSIWSYICCCRGNVKQEGAREPLRPESPTQQIEDDGRVKTTTPGNTPERPKCVKESKITSTNDYV